MSQELAPARRSLVKAALDWRNFLILAAAAAFSFFAPGISAAPEASAKGKPNIVVILGDDMGYIDLQSYGGKEIPTPNIDSLAKNGVRFTNGYVSCPVCSPTRAGLMTGRYQQRFGHEFNPGNLKPKDENFETFGLPLEEKTIADLIKDAGYKTGMVGKWHLGFEPKFNPTKRGFDEFFGFLGGAHPYLDPTAPGKEAILRGEDPVEEKEFLTEAFAREAVAFIDRHKDGPFFLYLPFNAVHAPLQATQKYLDRFSGIEKQDRRTHCAQMSALDDAVGAVLAKIRDAGLEQNTLIFFINDNGGPTPSTTADNGPLRATKGTVYEGGIRVPFIVQWTGRLPKGTEYHNPAIALDILPTAVAAAGGSLPDSPARDGVDLVPFLLGEKTGVPHDRLFWRFGNRSAMREGNLKLVKIKGQPAELYDLDQDIGEKDDLAEKKPELVKKLAASYEEWNSQLMAPRWPTKDRPEWQTEAEKKPKRP